jgi:hypothetical protein
MTLSGAKAKKRSPIIKSNWPHVPGNVIVRRFKLETREFIYLHKLFLLKDSLLNFKKVCQKNANFVHSRRKLYIDIKLHL